MFTLTYLFSLVPVGNQSNCNTSTYITASQLCEDFRRQGRKLERLGASRISRKLLTLPLKLGLLGHAYIHTAIPGIKSPDSKTIRPSSSRSQTVEQSLIISVVETGGTQQAYHMTITPEVHGPTSALEAELQRYIKGTMGRQHMGTAFSASEQQYH